MKNIESRIEFAASLFSGFISEIEADNSLPPAQKEQEANLAIKKALNLSNGFYNEAEKFFAPPVTKINAPAKQAGKAPALAPKKG